MAILETLLGTVSLAIGKAMLKRWLKDNDLGLAVGETLMDYVKKKITGIEEQKKIARQFEQIGDDVAKSLKPFFDAEHRMDEGEQSAAAYALASTIDKGSLNAKEIAEVNMNPTKLARRLKEGNLDATRDLSEHSTVFYNRLVDEACIRIVDIVDRMPHFQRDTLGEVLKRIDETTERMLTEFAEIRRNSEVGNKDLLAQQFESDYLRAVVRELDVMRLFGTDLPDRSKRYPLSVAYVSLSAIRTKDDTEQVFDVAAMLKQGTRLLFRGEPGSGKTTLLQWIAVRAAKHDFTSELADWNNLVPFFISLRKFAKEDQPLPQPEDFVKIVAPEIAGAMPEGWTHQKMREGRAVLLIDGLDEVSEARRTKICEWLQRHLGAFDKCRFLVASRPNAAEEDWMKGDQFQEATLQRMSLECALNFVQQWHLAVGQEMEKESERRELEEGASRLKTRFEDQPALRALAANPLLCAMICALNRNRNANIPERRVALYDACITMLLRRDGEREINVGDYPKLDELHKRRLLQKIAYWMQDNGLISAPKSDVETVLTQALTSLQNQPADTTPERVYRLLTERTAIARAPSEGFLDFSHRTFQEFLAAKHLLDEANFGVISKHALDDLWRETILLAAGQANEQQANRIVKELMDKADSRIARFQTKFIANNQRVPLIFLAAGCMGEAVALDKKTQQRTDKALATLTPPKRKKEAEAWARAKNHALPYLGYDSNLSIEEAQVRIHCLSLIGTPEAMGTLEGYQKDNRELLLWALIEARDGFSHSDYDARVLSTIRPILIGYPTAFESKERFLKAYGDVVQFFNQHSNIEDISIILNLNEVHINQNFLSDIRPLKCLTKLQTLSMQDRQTSELKELSHAQRCMIKEDKIIFIDVDMVEIPSGEFLMGSSEDDEEKGPGGKEFKVHLDTYYISKYPVTVAQFRKFTEQTRTEYDWDRRKPDWGWIDDHPMVNVAWEEARAYCLWVGGDLPTEAQWEKAARGTDGRKYPWGNDWDAQKCRCSLKEFGDSGGTISVGSYPNGVSPYGVHDMAGNVWEWCRDYYDEDYYKNAPRNNPENLKESWHRVLRGGSWDDDYPSYFRSAIRNWYIPTGRDNDNGFRCATEHR